MNFPQTKDQTMMAEKNIATNADFRLFIARIIYGVVFMVMVIQMVLHQLPYQCVPNPSTWLFKSNWRPIMSIVASTTVLIGFFIPSRLWSLITTIVMLGFNLSYFALDQNVHYNLLWWLLFVPLCFNQPALTIWFKILQWGMVILITISWMFTGNLSASIPLYCLYFLPFLPFSVLFDTFNRHYEPR